MSDGPWMIREIRGEELDEAIAFADERGCAIESGRVRPWRSLVARDDSGAVRGAVLCVGSAHQSVTLEVVVAGDEAEAAAASGDGSQPSPPAGAGVELAHQLIDKALGKMRCDHLHRCSIEIHGASGSEALWRAARWGDDLAGPAATDAYRSAEGSTGRTGTGSESAASSAAAESA